MQWSDIYGNDLDSLKGRLEVIKEFEKLLEISKKSNTPIYITGKSGVGKTVIVKGCLERNKYDYYTIGPDLIRSKKYIDDYFKNICNSMKIIDGKFVKSSKKALVFDALDALTAADIGCVPAIIENIKKYPKVVVVIITSIQHSPKISKLDSISNKIIVNPLSTRELISIAKDILSKNLHIKLQKSTIISLINEANGDARYFINSLQFIALNPTTGFETSNKDTILNLWECMDKLFLKDLTLDDSIYIADLEPRWVSNSVFENYISHINSRVKDIDLASNCIDNMCDANVLESFNTGNMCFDSTLTDVSTLMGVFLPTSQIKVYKHTNKPHFNIFPTLFGRVSNFKLNKSIVVDILSNTNIDRSIETMDFIKYIIFKLIENNEIEVALNTLRSYKFTKEYFNYLMRPSIFNLTDCRKNIKPKLKKIIESGLLEL